MFGDKTICLYESKTDGGEILDHGYDPHSGEPVDISEWTPVDLGKLDVTKYFSPSGYDGWRTLAVCQELAPSYLAGETMLDPYQMFDTLSEGGVDITMFNLLTELEVQFIGRWKMNRQTCFAFFEDSRDAIVFKLAF